MHACLLPKQKGMQAWLLPNKPARPAQRQHSVCSYTVQTLLVTTVADPTGQNCC